MQASSLRASVTSKLSFPGSRASGSLTSNSRQAVQPSAVSSFFVGGGDWALERPPRPPPRPPRPPPRPLRAPRPPLLLRVLSSAASLPLSAAFFSRFIPGHSAADTIVQTRRLVNATPRSGTRAPAMPAGIAGGITRRGDVIHAECALRSIVAIVRRQSTGAGGCVEPSPTAVEKKQQEQTRRI